MSSAPPDYSGQAAVEAQGVHSAAPKISEGTARLLKGTPYAASGLTFAAELYGAAKTDHRFDRAAVRASYEVAGGTVGGAEIGTVSRIVLGSGGGVIGGPLGGYLGAKVGKDVATGIYEGIDSAKRADDEVPEAPTLENVPNAPHQIEYQVPRRGK